jgi:hypothetical protein
MTTNLFTHRKLSIPPTSGYLVEFDDVRVPEQLQILDLAPDFSDDVETPAVDVVNVYSSVTDGRGWGKIS